MLQLLQAKTGMDGYQLGLLLSAVRKWMEEDEVKLPCLLPYVLDSVDGPHFTALQLQVAYHAAEKDDDLGQRVS